MGNGQSGLYLDNSTLYYKDNAPFDTKTNRSDTLQVTRNSRTSLYGRAKFDEQGNPIAQSSWTNLIGTRKLEINPGAVFGGS